MPVIDFTHFTPLPALAGGLLIGLAAALLLAFCGRVMGISGIVGGLMDNQEASVSHYGWRFAFLAGLFAASTVWRLFAPLPDVQMVAGNGMIFVAGLLVGFGTRMGSGCTSGHAVCGLARFSPRSMAATAAFMASGFVVASLLLHPFGK
jgi:uncharacterized membrane protein YedE/YeeE